MEKCVFPAKYGGLNQAQKSHSNPWRLVLYSFVIVTSFLGILPANAGRHYVDRPAYALHDQRHSVAIKIGPDDSKTSFFLDRSILCRIEFFRALLCSGFLESKNQTVSLAEDTVTLYEFIHLVDLAYLDEIEVRVDHQGRKEDLEGLLELISSNHFKKIKPFPEPSHGGLTQLVQEKIFEWIEKEDFQPELTDMTFLSLLFLRIYDGETLKVTPPLERAWVIAKRSWLLEKISELASMKSLSEADESALFREINNHSRDPILQTTLETRLRGLPRDYLFSSNRFCALQIEGETE